MNIMKELGIGKFSAAWAFLTGGWAGLLELICEAVTKLLAKADSETLKKYSELTAKIAAYIRQGIDTFVTKEAVKTAAGLTATAIEKLAEHISDGVYDCDEVNADIDCIKACIEAWKKVAA